MKTQAKTKDKNTTAQASSSFARSPFAFDSAVRNQSEAIRNILSSPVQTKIAIGSAGDQYEREADAVADKVVAGEQASLISRVSSLTGSSEKQPQRQVDTKDDEEQVQTKSKNKNNEEDKVQKKLLQRKKKGDDEEKIVQTKSNNIKDDEDKKTLQKKSKKDEEEKVQTKSNSASLSSQSKESSAAQAINNKGSGKPLNSTTKQKLESGIGADFSQVRVHDDSVAKNSARDLNARAFTYKNDIWLGEGESQSDTKLMAHEATHVVQQTGLVQGFIQRVEDTQDAGEIDEAAALRDLKTFKLPPVKARHLAMYQAWAASSKLGRSAGYPFNRGNPNQQSLWFSEVNINGDKLRDLDLDESFSGVKTITINGIDITGTYSRILNKLKVPRWNRRGGTYKTAMEVDHIVELQVGMWNGSSGSANTMENIELLDKSSNASSGSSTKGSIRSNVRNYLRALGQPSNRGAVNQYLTDNEIDFDRVEIRSRGRNESSSEWWLRSEIERGDHLEGARVLGNVGESGNAGLFALVSPGGFRVLGEFEHSESQMSIAVTDEINKKSVAGITINTIELNDGYALADDGSQIGTIEGSWDLPQGFSANGESLSLAINKQTQYSGYIGSFGSLESNFSGLSALRFEQVELDGGGVSAVGRLTPSIPLLGDLPIDIELSGSDIRFAYYYSPEQLNSPIPALNIDEALLGVYFGTDGFGAEGAVDFSIEQLGSGNLSVGVDSEKNFEASGQFQFDTELFDRAEISVWYRNNVFGGSGTLGIDSPEKVRGIESAEVSVSFNEGVFNANGTVSPAIPGVQEAGLNMTYSEEDGLIIGGDLQLTDSIPGINSGSIEAEVRRQADAEGYSLSAQGTAQPAIPGIDSSITVSYNDGAFSIEGEAAYERGMIAGSILIGATNRIVDAQGNPTDEIGESISAYGGGTVTVQIAPWLQGRVGVKLLANGEIELMGEIALPDTLDIFPEKRLDKNIFSINMDIPILGFAVAGQRVGIFATIGGGLDLSAGVGPGQLQELGLGITYNPEREEETRVTGGAKLVIPADAGLRLFVRGALGAGIPIVSAQLGLEVGGQLGLEGAAEASVQVDWTPQQGLVLDALGEIYVEPKFRFDLTGFALVEADLFISTIELYSERWELAALELGPDLRFGVRFPIHYEENQPFELSWDSVEFVVPDVNTSDLLDDLIKQIV